MRRALIGAATCAAALGACAQAPVAAALAPPTPSATVSAEVSVEAGRRAYTSSCTRCHGIGLVVTSSAYYDLRTFPKDDKQRFIDSVANGKRQMPAWNGILKPEAIESIWLYVGSVNGW